MITWPEARVVVTGGSSGIGLAVAEQMARRGALVALCGRSEQRLQHARRKLGRAHALVCDVADDRSVKSMVREAVRKLGRVDVLVNCAGQGVRGPVRHTSVGDVSALIEVNYLGAVRVTLEVLPLLLRQETGTVVNVASVAGLYGVPDLGAYGASKAALAAFGQALRLEVGGAGIRIVNVYPDYTSTPFFAREKQVGAARPPAVPFASAAWVAARVVRAVERQRDEVVLSARGRLLRVLAGLAPGVLDRLISHWQRRHVACAADRSS